MDRNNIASSKRCGINIEWLKGSNNYEIGRNIVIQGNEIKLSGKDGILIQSFLNFSAHNIKILIKQNSIHKNNGDGITIKNLAISNLEISENEVVKN